MQLKKQLKPAVPKWYSSPAVTNAASKTTSTKHTSWKTELELRQKDKLLAHVRDILPPDITCLYIRQTEALGLGHAVLCAQAAVGDEPFAVILADDLIDAPKGALKQMVDVYNQKRQQRFRR